MAYTTSYTLKRFDATASIMYVVVNILNDAATPAIIETISSFPIKLPIDSTGAVPQGNALNTVVTGVLNNVFDATYLEQRKNQYDNGGSVVTNASLIYTLTSEEEVGETSPQVVGFVFDTSGAPVDSATVTSSNGESATTDISGGFLFNATAGNQKVSVTKAGYVENFKMIAVGGITNVSFVLLAESGTVSSVSLTGLTSGAVTGTGTGRVDKNAEVEFPANAIVDVNNNPVTDATLKIGNIVVSDTGAPDIFPGYFLGDVSGSNNPIESYGFLQVSVADGNGNPLSLDPAVGATIRMPVDPDPVGENTIPTWRLNETTGIWEQGQDATRVGTTNVFEFPVTSFSWYNIDQPLTDTCSLTVSAFATEDGVSNPINAKGVDITINVETTNWNGRPTLWQGRGTTDSNGQLTLDVPPGYLEVSGKKGLTTYYGYTYETSGSAGSCTAAMNIFPDTSENPIIPAPPVLNLISPPTLTLNQAITLTWEGGGVSNTIKVDTLDIETELPTTTTILSNSILVSGSVSFTPTTANEAHVFYIEATNSAGNVSTVFSENSYQVPQ